MRLDETDGRLDAGESVPGDRGPVRGGGRDAGRDELGAGAPAVDAGERAAAGDAGGGAPRAERDGLVRAGGASGVGGVGARGLDERRAADAVARARGGGW